MSPVGQVLLAPNMPAVVARAALTGSYSKLAHALQARDLETATHGLWLAILTVRVLPPRSAGRLMAEKVIVHLSRYAPSEALRKSAFHTRHRLGIVAAGFALEPIERA